MNVPICSRRSIILAVSAACLAAPALALAQEADGDNDGDDGPAKPVTEVIVSAKRLDAARANLDPSLGASTYALSNAAVESRPGSETISLNQVLLQAPGVQRDGSGQLHVRQSHGDLQYRINNVIIPEGLTDLGESLSARIAQRVELVTGALPAQYGFQAGGVVNITTKDGVYLNGGQAELYGGGRGEIEPAFEYGTSVGATNLFVSGSFMRSQTGLASLNGSASPAHDRTDQADGFAYLDRLLDAETRLSLIMAISDERFQLPNGDRLNPAPGAPFVGPLTIDAASAVPIGQIDDHRREATQFAIASVIRSTDKATVQASLFARNSILTLQAEGVGDLLYKGVGQYADSRDLAYGLQAEGVYELASAHTLRAGLLVSLDAVDSLSRLTVLPISSDGVQTSSMARTLRETTRPRSDRESLFVQDEWRATGSLTVNAGLRYDQAKTNRRDGQLSPRVNLVWIASSGATAHAGYARYFLPAPVEDAGETPADLANTTAALPTSRADPLRSETDNYYDLGIQQAFDGLTVGIDAYLRQARDLIADGQFGLGDLNRNFNYGQARIRGVEFSATYAQGALSAWSNLSVANSDGRSITSNQAYFNAAQLASIAGDFKPLSQDQGITISAGASYRWGGLRTSADLTYGSGLPNSTAAKGVNGGHLPPYAQIDIAIVYRAAMVNGHALDVRMDVINAVDGRYQLRDGSGVGDGPPQWGPRRGVFFGFEQSF